MAVAERQVSAEFVFDRAGDQALVQAYRTLVPERRARTVQRKDDDDNNQTSAAHIGEGEHRSAVGA